LSRYEEDSLFIDEVDDTIASHLDYTEEIIEECFLVLGVADITGVNGDFIDPLEEPHSVLPDFLSPRILEKLDESLSIILE